MAIFAACAFGVVVLQVTLLGAYDLITRPLWFDECLTALLAGDESFTQEMRALAGGVDTNMPGLYVLLRPMHWAGLVTPEGLRWWSLIWVLVAITVMYAYARRFAPPAGAVMAASMLWAHPLVMAHAFEARFYGPLLAATALVALALESNGRRAKWWLAAASTLLCALHYFGVIVLALMLAAMLLTRRRKLKDIWPAGLGLIVTLACLPFYFSQRASFAATDWMEPVSAASTTAMLAEIAPLSIFAVIALAAVATVLWRRTARAPLPAALLALLAMPFVLLAISLTVQPVLMGRYAIGFALALSAGGAWLLRDAPRVVLIALSVAMLAVSCWQLRRIREFQLMAGARMAMIADGVDQVPAPAVFASGFDALPVWMQFEELRPRLRVLEEELNGQAGSRKAEVVRAQMRNVRRFYRVPEAISAQRALGERAFTYVPWEDADVSPALEARYQVQQINPFVYLFARSE